MDEILDNFVGGHGKYQIAITIATSLINEFANGIFLMHIFTAYAPKHRCRVPQCETINATKVRIGNILGQYTEVCNKRGVLITCR